MCFRLFVINTSDTVVFRPGVKTGNSETPVASLRVVYDGRLVWQRSNYYTKPCWVGEGQFVLWHQANCVSIMQN